MAFGLAPASYVFTKVLRPMVKKWRGEGKSTSLYLYDGIIVGKTHAETLPFAAQAMHDLEEAGFTINRDKSKLAPAQKGVYLGFIIDSQQMMFIAPPEKISQLKSLVEVALKGKFTQKIISFFID